MVQVREAAYALHVATKNAVRCADRPFLTASLGETVMKSQKLVVGVASIATLFLTLTPVAYGATITLRPNLDSTPQMLVASLEEPSCTTPHTDAALAGIPYFEVPEIAEAKGDSGTSVVEVDLLSSGALKHYALEQSSGNPVLDDSALRTARMTKYQPETRNCAAVPGSYLLVVDF
jgi:TonB family protein